MVHGEESCSEFADYGGVYIIRIDKSLSFDAAVDALIHEVAHLNDVVKHGWGADHAEWHGDSWGKEYSRLYRDYHEAEELEDIQYWKDDECGK